MRADFSCQEFHLFITDNPALQWLRRRARRGYYFEDVDEQTFIPTPWEEGYKSSYISSSEEE
jgi:hypothetical protein